MKNIKYLGLVVAAVLTAGVAQQAKANFISGSIGFSGIDTVNNASLASATAFTSINAYVSTASGTYGSLLSSTVGTFTPGSSPVYPLTSTGSATGGSVVTPGLISDYTFSPPQGSVTPLWAFEIGGVSYSFDATSMTASFQNGGWSIAGGGYANVTGYSQTTGNWTATITASGTSFVFGSTATVPDGGMTLMLLGGAMTALGAIRSKVSKK